MTSYDWNELQGNPQSDSLITVQKSKLPDIKEHIARFNIKNDKLVKLGRMPKALSETKRRDIHLVDTNNTPKELMPLSVRQWKPAQKQVRESRNIRIARTKSPYSPNKKSKLITSKANSKANRRSINLKSTSNSKQASIDRK